jgi:endonuclease-3
MKSPNRSSVRPRSVAKKPRASAPTGGGGRPPKLKSDAIADIFHRFAAENPEPKGELESVNPFTLLVAVVLSAQATDAGVNKATRLLFQKADAPEKMITLGEEKLREMIKTIGLYRNKARNVILLSHKLIVVLNVAFGEPTMAVDTHVFRVANRIGLSNGKTPLAVEEDLLRIVPPEMGVHAHHWLILHGRYVCKARRPECERCIINDLCLFKGKTV